MKNRIHPVFIWVEIMSQMAISMKRLSFAFCMADLQQIRALAAVLDGQLAELQGHCTSQPAKVAPSMQRLEPTGLDSQMWWGQREIAALEVKHLPLLWFWTSETRTAWTFFLWCSHFQWHNLATHPNSPWNQTWLKLLTRYCKWDMAGIRKLKKCNHIKWQTDL